MSQTRTPRLLSVSLAGFVLLVVAACTSDPGEMAASSVNGPSLTASDAAMSENVITADPSDTNGDVVPRDTSTAVPSTVLPSAENPATSPVPAPGGGDVNQTVATSELTSAPSVALTDIAEVGPGVTLQLVSIEQITTTAELPGEIAGPGVAVTVEIVNGSDAVLDLANVIVDLQDGAGTPALPMSTSPAEPFSGSLNPGESGSGIYVFTVPTSYTNPASISVSYSTEVPVAVFVGDAK